MTATERALGRCAENAGVRTEARRALAEGWPIVLTSVVVGIAFGIAAREAGLDAAEASGMSLFIFAGAAQFAAVELIGRNAPAPLVVATVVLLNLRHLLMAAALRAQLARSSVAQRALSAYLLTDESFAMGIAHLRRGGQGITYYLTFAASLWLGWNAATVLGATLVSDAIDPARYGLDFAITATFVAIVVIGIRGRADIAVAVVAGVTAGALRLVGASAIAVVAAGATAPLIAVALRPRMTEEDR